MARARQLVRLGFLSRVPARLAMIGPLVLVSLGGPPSALGATTPAPAARVAAAAPALGDLIVPAAALGPGWAEVEREALGDGEIRVRHGDETDFSVPREATFWVRVAPHTRLLQSSLAFVQDAIGSTGVSISPVDLGDTPDAVKAVTSSADGGAVTVGYAFVVDRANAFVSVQGAPEEQADLEDQGLAFANLQADRLTGGLPETPAVLSPGAVILSDNFDDPARGRLPKTSTKADTRLGYEGGEYVLARTGPAAPGGYLSVVPDTYTDTTVAVDARIVGDPASQEVGVLCRRQKDSGNHYRFSIRTDRSAFALSRWDGQLQVRLAGWQPSEAIKGGDAWNHLELTCSGSRLSASINGSPVVSIRDSTYPSGQLALITGQIGTGQIRSEAHFDDLVIAAAATPEDAGPAPAPGPAGAAWTPSAPQATPVPGTVLVADTFDDPTRGMLPQLSTDPQHIFLGYEDGEYAIRTIDADWAKFMMVVVPVPGVYSDATLAVDVRITDPPDVEAPRDVAIECRGQPDGSSYYSFRVSPFDGTAKLTRGDPGGSHVLVDWHTSGAIHKGNERNRIALTCAKQRIAATINGEPVFSVRDATYASGVWLLAVGSSEPVRTEARFDNLVLTAEAGW